MEFSAELDFGLDELIVITECHFCQLNAKGELTALIDLIFVLNVWMHITKEQLLVICIRETHAHTLIRRGTLLSKSIVSFNNIVKDYLIKHLHFHFESLHD